MEKDTMEKYAELIIKTGLCLQKGQPLVIAAEIDAREFVLVLAEKAYALGASDVVVDWKDGDLSRMKFAKGAEHVFGEAPGWLQPYYKYYDNQGACYASILSEDPDLLKDAPADRVKSLRIALGKALTEHRKNTMESHVRWCVAAYPGEKWAKKVFPLLEDKAAVESLSRAILRASRVDTPDPVQAWETHKANFQKRVQYLNEKQYGALHYSNSLGTDFTVTLPAGHIWMGGGEKSTDGQIFCPNIPSEEIFTLPDKRGAQGIVYASLPLCYNGVTIENFWLEFKDGKAVNCGAEKNLATLEGILETDEGARYLGEVALVQADSPIANMGILFYNTLFDENASCHFALGKAYPTCLAGFDKLSQKELDERGVNDSITHVDFMVGTRDTKIQGICRDGKKEDVFVDGNFVI